MGSNESIVPAHFYRQSGTIPYRLTENGPEILLVTTARKKRWTIPKGIIEPELSAAESARKETEEEAGVRGRLREPAIGTYEQKKWGALCSIEVFLLEVTETLDEYEDAGQRQRRWFPVDEAAERVRSERLRDYIRAVPGITDGRSGGGDATPPSSSGTRR